MESILSRSRDQQRNNALPNYSVSTDGISVMRTKGSKNITYFGDCESIPTSSTANVKHLKELATGNPLKQFE